MSHTQYYGGGRPGRCVSALTALISAVAVAGCVTACGSGTAATAAGASASPSQPASPGTAAGSGALAHRKRGTSADRPATPGAVLARWIHQVAAGHRRAACQDMRQPGFAPQRSTAICMSAAGMAAFNALHNTFAPDGIGPRTPIRVSAAHISGTSATVGGSHVRVSGRTLDSLIVAHSTGLKPGQLDISFQFSRVDGAWYVTGWNLKV